MTEPATAAAWVRWHRQWAEAQLRRIPVDLRGPAARMLVGDR